METGLAGWIEIFRVGKQTDSKGVERTFTEADLDQMVQNAWGSSPIPHVITHKELYSPFAYAQAVELRREADKLLARSANIEPQFEKLVADGRLYSRSVRMIPTEQGWKITHIAWLGAEPPAIDGLAPIQFSAEPSAIDFSFPTKPTSPEGAPVNDKTNSGGGAGLTQADIDAAVEKAKRETAADFAQDKARLEAELKLERDNQRKALWQDRINTTIRDGRLTPAQAEGMAEFALGLSDGAIEFARNTGGKDEVVKVASDKWFVDFVAKLPKQVAMAHGGNRCGVGGSGVDLQDADAIAKVAVEYQAEMLKKGITISASAAVAHVTKGDK